MLSSISPVGEQGRQQRWSVTVSAYLLGSVIGGTTVGAIAGGMGQLALSGVSTTTRVALLGSLALAGLGLDLTVGVPSLHRQVDERWLTSYRGWVYGGGFGLQLGTGLVTIIPSSVVWVLWIGTVLGASLPVGVVVGAAFGLARGMPLVLAGRVRTVSGLRRTLARMDRVRPRIARLTPVLQGAIGTALLVTVVVGAAA